MEVSGQLHAPAAVPPEEEPAVSIEWEALVPHSLIAMEHCVTVAS
jgi:hypothetical protein